MIRTLALLEKLRDLLSSEPPLGRGREHQDGALVLLAIPAAAEAAIASIPE
jgi:hypothetical protein